MSTTASLLESTNTHPTLSYARGPSDHPLLEETIGDNFDRVAARFGDRDALIELARNELGLIVEERAVDRTELYIADEVFMCGTAAEISPIVSVDRYDVGDGQIGPVTKQLEGLLDDCFRGKTGIRPEWRSPVGAAKPVAAD